MPLHSVQPPMHWHCAATQSAPTGHGLPQAPQFQGSVCSSTQEDPQVESVPQPDTHVLALQKVFAGQACPHALQFLPSLSVDTQSRLHTTDADDGQTQAPFWHGESAPQRLPQIPQFSGSDCTLTHVGPHRDRPGAHLDASGSSPGVASGPASPVAKDVWPVPPHSQARSAISTTKKRAFSLTSGGATPRWSALPAASATVRRHVWGWRKDRPRRGAEGTFSVTPSGSRASSGTLRRLDSEDSVQSTSSPVRSCQTRKLAHTGSAKMTTVPPGSSTTVSRIP
jgi:hypothetical protein